MKLPAARWGYRRTKTVGAAGDLRRRFRIRSGPEGASFHDESTSDSHGVDEPNDGKAVMECEENLSLGTVDKSEI